MVYAFTPGATQPYKFTFTIPNDLASVPYKVVGYTVGVTRDANGDPKAWGMDPTNVNSFWANFTSTDAHTVTVLLTLTAPIQ
jgi:hypothetical protein